MGLTVKRNDNLEKMFDQLTTQTKTSVEEKEKKNKFLAKGTNKKDSKNKPQSSALMLLIVVFYLLKVAGITLFKCGNILFGHLIERNISPFSNLRKIP